MVWWPFMNKVQIKVFLLPQSRWVHLYLLLIIPFGTSYLLIWVNLFAQRPDQHARNYKSSDKTIQIIYPLPMVCVYQPFRLVQSCQWSLFQSFYIECFDRWNWLISLQILLDQFFETIQTINIFYDCFRSIFSLLGLW